MLVRRVGDGRVVVFCCACGYVVGERGAACCRHPMGRRFRFDPCIPGRSGVGRLACGLFIVGSLCCSSLIGSRLCSPRRCSRTRSLSSRFVLRVAAACLSDAVDVSRPGRARCVVWIRRRLFDSGQPVWVAWWPVWARLAVFGRCSYPYTACFPSGMLFRGVPGFGISAHVVVVLLALLWLVRHRLRRPIAGLCCRWTRLVVAVMAKRVLRGRGVATIGTTA